MGTAKSRPASSVRGGLVALCLLLSPVLSGQTASDITVYVQEEPVRVGETFFVYIEIPSEYAGNVGFGPAPVQDRLRYWAGPAWLAQDDIGRVRYRYSYRADEAGYASLGPFVIQWPGRRVQTETLLVPVTVDGLVPPELEWRIPEEPIYAGQTVYVSLDVHRTAEIIFPETLTVNSANGGIIEEVTGLGELSSYEFFGETFNRIPLATFLYTPLEDGALRLPSAEARFGDYPRTVSAEPIRVLALPSNPGSGAVGSFQLDSSPLPDTVVAGSEFSFELSVSGTGNLGVLKLPDISLQGASIEGREEIADYVATEQGYSGSRAQAYRIRAAASGEITITIPEFAWFDPELGLVRSNRQQAQRVPVIPRDEPAEPSFGDISQPMELADRSVNFSEGPLGALLFLVVPLYLLVYFSAGKKWKKRNIYGSVLYTIISLVAALIVSRNIQPGPSPEEELEAFYRSSNEGSAALLRGERLLAENPHNTRLLFSLAQLEYANGRAARAMQLMRGAVSLAPARPDFREALLLLEEEMNLLQQYRIPRLIHGDWAYLVILLLLMLSALYFSLVDFAPSWNVPFVVGGVMCIALLILSLVLYHLYYRGVNNQAAVVQEGGVMLKKIPDPDAADWIFLSEGTSVDSGVLASGYVQIRTAYGIVAWIPEDKLYLYD